MNDEETAKEAESGDDALLAELRAMASRYDPVPAEAIAAARSALAWRTLDAELAALTADSSVSRSLAGVRGVATPTLLTFECGSLTLEVEVTEGRGGRRLLGQFVSPGPPTVEIRHPGGTTLVEVDEVGRFSATDIPPGPVRLEASVGGQVVVTDWFLI